VRYLQKAILELDYEQWKLVREALHERKIFLQTAPYLSHSLPIMLPLYKYWQMPYYWAGCKMYDMLAGGENMESSYIMSKGKAQEAFPLLKSDGLVGAMVYYDGQHNDSRMNLALILTAVQRGAVVANYAEVTGLHKSKNGKLDGAVIKDTLTGESFNVRAKGVINATGPFSDSLFTLAAAKPELHKPIVQPSSGVHITLPNYYSPGSLGLIDPQTSDGRVIFFLPWQGNTIAGTTDSPSRVEKDPVPREEDIQWILEEIRTYLSPDIKVRRGDVLSAWSGLRPLVRDPTSTKSGTAALVRSHLINVSEEGLLTIAGGKWTTYRAMAAETVDRAIEEFNLQDKTTGNGQCITENIRLIGSDAWSPNMFISLIQRFGLETEVAKHLAMNYGDRAWTVCSYLQESGEQWPHHGIKVSPQYPFIEAEIRYAVHHEYAQTAIDFLSRRSRLSFLNSRAALDALPRVIDVMGQELKWDSKRKRAEYERATQQLKSMGLTVLPLERTSSWSEWLSSGFGLFPTARISSPSPHTRAIFSPGELENARSSFTLQAQLDTGKVASQAIVRAIQGVKGFENVKDKHVKYAIRQVGIKETEDIGVDDFIEICSSLKEIMIAPEAIKPASKKRSRIPVEKSGGGV